MNFHEQIIDFLKQRNFSQEIIEIPLHDGRTQNGIRFEKEYSITYNYGNGDVIEKELAVIFLDEEDEDVFYYGEDLDCIGENLIQIISYLGEL